MNKIKVITVSLLCTLSMGAMAQTEKEAKVYTPEVGSFAIGVNFNPVAAAQGGNAASFSTVGQFLYGSASDDGIISNAESKPNQMYILAQQPMVAFSFKYKAKEQKH